MKLFNSEQHISGNFISPCKQRIHSTEAITEVQLILMLQVGTNFLNVGLQLSRES